MRAAYRFSSVENVVGTDQVETSKQHNWNEAFEVSQKKRAREQFVPNSRVHLWHFSHFRIIMEISLELTRVQPEYNARARPLTIQISTCDVAHLGRQAIDMNSNGRLRCTSNVEGFVFSADYRRMTELNFKLIRIIFVLVKMKN